MIRRVSPLFERYHLDYLYQRIYFFFSSMDKFLLCRMNLCTTKNLFSDLMICCQQPESFDRFREIFLYSLCQLFICWSDTKLGKFQIGHVTKSGEIAGPRVLEHIVDVVLYMEVGTFWISDLSSIFSYSDVICCIHMFFSSLYLSFKENKEILIWFWVLTLKMKPCAHACNAVW